MLLPLATLGVIALAIRPRWRSTFGPLVLAVTALATALIPLATDSGESLERTVDESPLVEQHAELGDALLWFALPLLVMAVALWWMGRQTARERPVSTAVALTLAILAVVVGVANGVQVARVGHSGAKSVWSDEG